MAGPNLIRRFSLYGFLKNQQYYEPFLVLAFLQMGLSYTLIGAVIGFRDAVVNLMEIPSGALADLWGRRRSMLVSFGAYIVSFLLLGGTGTAATSGALGTGALVFLLLLAMAFFGVGEAFRTGTHKAMIFSWLRLQGRTGERTRVYGYTRSWSKIGSAVSVVLACGFVLWSREFVAIFYLSAVPYVLNIVNVAGYPAALDGGRAGKVSLGQVLAHLRQALGETLRRAPLRRLVAESMGFEGFFKAAKDYLQPVLQQAAVPVAASLFAGVALDEVQRPVILVGPVYFGLFLLSAAASRKAHVLVRARGHEEGAARTLWLATLLVLAAMAPAMYWGAHALVIAGFVELHLLQNVWRPILIARVDAHCREASGATVLSVESQAKSAATMVLAPALGAAVDWVQSRGLGATPFWPLALVGAVIALGFFLSAPGQPARPPGPTGERDPSSP
ncbi:MAG: hypothetical protein Kow0092_33240 [Deferrisomatales bacterium]